MLPTPPETRDRILALRAEGRTYAEIADLVGVSANTIGVIVRSSKRALIFALMDAKNRPPQHPEGHHEGR